jgi:tail assembly chaperone
MANQIGLPSTTVQIDGHSYTITALDAVTARRIWTRLFKAFGAGAESLRGADEASILQFLSKFVQALPEDLVDEMADTYARNCTVKADRGNPKVSDVYMFHFARKPAHHIRWLVECTKWNFADFLDGSTGLSLFGIKAPVVSELTSQTT